MKRLIFTAAFVGLCVWTGFSARALIAEPRAKDPTAEKEKLVELQKERCAVLRQIVHEFEKRHHQGMIAYLPVSQAIVEWLNAELDLAGDRGARIAVRERIVEHLRAREKTFASERAAEPGENCDLLSARAARLQAEVELLREKMAGD